MPNSPSPTPPLFSADPQEDLVQYRPFSWAAIGAAVCMVLSLPVLITPLMLWAPLAAVLLAIGALRKIAREQPAMLGRKLALLALTVSLFLAASGVTRAIVRTNWIYDQARLHSQHWIELVRSGELQVAHQLHLSQDDRVGPGMTVPRFYRENPAAERVFQEFFKSSPLAEIVALGDRGRLEFVGNASQRREVAMKGRAEAITQNYRIVYEEDGQPRSLPFQIEIVRVYLSNTGEVRWYVRSVRSPPVNGFGSSLLRT
jgi:hypothetical protein